MIVDQTVHICLWSGPRNISTAMMRAFEARPDCTVVDEPFYGYFLKETGVDHPGREETLQAWPTDYDGVLMEFLIPRANPTSERFYKMMCQHMLPGTPLDWTKDWRHIFLIRDPAEVAASFYATTGFARAEDLGAIQQRELYDQIRTLTGRDWPVIEGRDVLENPGAMLDKLCQALHIPYHDSMLSWPRGRRDTDGPWAPYWYERVEASTGFEPYTPGRHSLPDGALPAVEDSSEAYNFLKARKLRL